MPPRCAAAKLPLAPRCVATQAAGSAAPSLRWVAQRPLPAHGASGAAPSRAAARSFRGWILRTREGARQRDGAR